MGDGQERGVGWVAVAFLFSIATSRRRSRRAASSRPSPARGPAPPAVRGHSAHVWAVLRSPPKLALLLGGNALAEILYASCLWACLEAFGTSLSIWTLLSLNILIGTVASLAPIPGGSTAVSSVGVSGGSTAFRVPAELAVPTVLADQIVVKYVPALIGWFATNHLVRRDYLSPGPASRGGVPGGAQRNYGRAHSRRQPHPSLSVTLSPTSSVDLQMPNIELKAHLADPNRARERLAALGIPLARDHAETDTYFPIANGRLKWRESSERAPRLIGYRRPDDDKPRKSDFQIADVQNPGDVLLDILKAELGTTSVVHKQRRTYHDGDTLINIDTLFEAYHFLEIEVQYLSDIDASHALHVARQYMEILGIQDRDLVAKSYEQLAAQLSQAVLWRHELGSTIERLVLIDGPSGAGKSTIVGALASSFPGAAYVRRTTSRPRRKTDDLREYEFVSLGQFQEAERDGQFLEYREFLFDMRYGLRWSNINEALNRGTVAMGLMNLGNVRHVKAIAPEVTTVLITAPIDTLRGRLRDRQLHSTEAIAERLENARSATAQADLYDHVVTNTDGALGASQQLVEKVLRSVSRD